jgi:hypothetical protein
LGVAITLALLACTAVLVVLHSETVDVNDEHVLETEWTESTAMAAGGDSVVDAIVDLKAYSIAAKEVLDGMSNFKGKLKSGAMEFVGAFGKKTGKEIITEFAQTIGELEAKHPIHPGLSEYMLTSLNEAVLRGEPGIVLDPKSNKFMLSPKAFGLSHRPDYFKKLQVSTRQFMSVKTELKEGSTGKALAAFSKSNLNTVYTGMVAKLTAKYMAQQEKENMFEEAGGKIAIQTSLAKGEKDGAAPHMLVPPLPVAGVTGSQAVRKSRGFKMPSVKAVQEEAMKAAKAAQKAQAAKYGTMTIDQIVMHVEGILEGTTVKVTSGTRLFADSDQSPSIKIVGSLGTVSGKIDYLPLGGYSLEQHFVTKGSLGIISHIVLTGDKKHDNPWLAKKFEVQVGHGNPWVEFAPNGKTSFVDGWWLDSKSVKGPYYRLAHYKKWLLLPTTQVSKYVRRFKGKAPVCATIKCMAVKTLKEMETACNNAKKCQGFTFDPKGDPMHNGCLKYRCNTATQDVDTDTGATFSKKNVDYYVKQAFAFAIEQPPGCPIKCGFKGATFKGRRYCAQTVNGKEVAYEKCALWHPALFVPKIPSRKCPANPPCVQYQTKPSAKCTKKCNTPQHTLYGSVSCNLVKGGGVVGMNKCKVQEWPILTKPATPSTFCKVTPVCVKYEQIDAAKCVTKCGTPAKTHYGQVVCKTIGGRPATMGQCSSQADPKLSKPSTPVNSCPKTLDCADWKLTQPTEACVTKCGTAAHSFKGSVKCVTTKGSIVSDSRCSHTSKPATPVKSCYATAACPTPAPTPSPTPHPCDSGQHSCDRNNGQCYKTNAAGANGYYCGCKGGFKCTSGCAMEHQNGYIGCYKDENHARDLPYKKYNGSWQSCKSQCSGYNYMGRQYTNECWCGNSYGSHGSTDGCSTCTGDGYQGSWRNCVFMVTPQNHVCTKITGAPTPKPTANPTPTPTKTPTTKAPTKAPTTKAPTKAPYVLYVYAKTGTKTSADSSDNPKVTVTNMVGKSYTFTLTGLPSKGKTKTWTFHPSFALGRLSTVTLRSQNVDAWEVTDLQIKNPSLDTSWYSWECPGGFWLDGKPYDDKATYGNVPYGDKQVLKYNNCPKPTPPPTPFVKELGSCPCSVSVYADNHYRDILQQGTYPTKLGGPKEVLWHPAHKSSIHSIKVGDGCSSIMVGDDDYGSVNSVDHTPYSPPGVPDLPYDLQGDVLWIKLYPKQTCCVNCK